MLQGLTNGSANVAANGKPALPRKPEKPERKFNSRELIEKQRNWTSHFSKRRPQNASMVSNSIKCKVMQNYNYFYSFPLVAGWSNSRYTCKSCQSSRCFKRRSSRIFRSSQNSTYSSRTYRVYERV